jgi:hypothetical protein
MTMILDGTNGAFLPTWTTGTRPASPANGQIGYNSTTGQIDQYVGSAWSSVPTSSASQATATALGTVYAKQTTGGGTPFLTAFGYNAGVSTTGVSNTAIGTQALYTNTTGTYNTVSGYQAAYTTTSGFNTIYGAFAGYYVTGTNNSYFGYAAGSQNSNATGSYNVGVGDSALFANTTANNCTAVGYQAGYSNTTGVSNTSVGLGALYSTINGEQNSGFGVQALYSNSSGSFNTAIGKQSLYSNTVSYNTAVGHQAGYSNSTADGCVYIGYQAGYNTTTNGDNTYVGWKAGYNSILGYQNVCIGNKSSINGTGDNNEIVVGYNLTGKGTNTGFYGGVSGIYSARNLTVWDVTSDERIKKNIVDNTEGLNKINQIRVRNFEYRLPEEIDESLKPTDAIDQKGIQLGVIAQELQQVMPECVKTESSGVMTVNADPINWYLVNAVKELYAEVQSLKAKLGT